MLLHADVRWIRLLVVIGFLLGSLWLPGCEKQPQTVPENAEPEVPVVQPTPTMPTSFEGEVVIYVVAPLSGQDAEKGQAQAAGARLAADHFNRRGGLLKRKIVINVLNDAGEPEKALEAAQTIAEAAKTGREIAGVLLHEGSDPQLETVQKVYAGLDLLVVLPASTEPSPAESDQQQMFRLSAPNSSQAAEIAAVFQEWNLNDVVLVHTSTPYGKMLAREFSEIVQHLDLNTVASFEIPTNATSYSDVATQIQAINPAGLFFAGEDIEAGIFLSDLFGFEFQGTVIGADRALSYNVIDELGCQAEGMNFISLLPEPATVMESAQLAHYAELEGRAAEPYTVAGYLGVEFLVRAYEQTGALDAGQAAITARQKKLATLIGEMSFDDQGKTQNPQLHFFQVQGRVFKEAFARKVGAGPQVSQTATDTKTTMLEQNFAPDKEPIIFAGLNWNSALFGNSIARFIIESGYGYPTYAVDGSSVPLFQSLQKGDLHVYMEVWLPNTQELYDQALTNNQVVDLGLYFGDAVQGWFVPKYVVEGDSKRNIEAAAPDLNSVEDLKRYAHLFASQEQPGIGRLLDGSPGWFSYKIDCMKLKAYRLDDKYAQVTTGSGSVLFNRLNDAYENGKPILLYLFGPSWPMAKFDLKQLKEPEFTQACWNTDKGCEFPLNQVKIVVYKTLPQQAPEVAEFLGKFQLESEEISQVLLLMKEKDLKPEDAALIWLKDHEEIWSQWVTADAAQKVKQMLSK